MVKIEKRFKKPDNVLWFVRSTMRNMCSLREKTQSWRISKFRGKKGKVNNTHGPTTPNTHE